MQLYLALDTLLNKHLHIFVPDNTHTHVHMYLLHTLDTIWLEKLASIKLGVMAKKMKNF